MDIFDKMKLHELYYCVLIDNLYDEDILPYDMEYIWLNINKRYYNIFKINLDINNEKDRWILYKWLRDNSRYDLLDELILNVYNRLINIEEKEDIIIDNTDLFMANNIKVIKKIINDFLVYLINQDYSDNYNNISYINKEDIIKIVKDILYNIDASDKWLNIYEELLKNDKIIYLNELSDKDKQALLLKFGVTSFKDIDNSCVFLRNNEAYILLNYKNTLADIPATIHEITHFVSRIINNTKTEIPVLREFSAIFFELYALNYLKNNGFNKEEVDGIYYDRVRDSYNMIESTLNILNYLEIIICKGKIDKSDCYKLSKDILDGIKNKHSSIELDEIVSDKYDLFKYQINSDNCCDKCIQDLVINPYILFGYYPYIIGHYLAILGINEYYNDSDILTIIKDINEALPNINPYNVFKILECPYDLIDTNKTKKRKNKG